MLSRDSFAIFLNLRTLGPYRIKKTDFAKLGWSFQISYLRNEVGDPNFFLFQISESSSSLPSCSKSFVKKSMLEDFYANVLQHMQQIIFSLRSLVASQQLRIVELAKTAAIICMMKYIPTQFFYRGNFLKTYAGIPLQCIPLKMFHSWTRLVLRLRHLQVEIKPR